MSTNTESQIFSNIGIFGIFSDQQENYFQILQNKFSNFSSLNEKNVFNHLSLIVHKNIPTNKINSYLNFLKELKMDIPLHIPSKEIIIKDENSFAFSFNISITQQLRQKALSTLRME